MDFCKLTACTVTCIANENRGIKLADTKNNIYIAYGCSIIATILITVPLVILVKRRQNRPEHVKISNATLEVAANQ